MFSCGYCKILLLWLLLIVLPQYSKVTWGACFLISCHHMFSILIKTFMKRCTNNSLLSRGKTISSLLELKDHVLSISQYVLEKQLLSILMKNLHKALRIYCVIHMSTDFLPLHFAVGQVLSISGYDLENSIVVKIPILILFRFCLLCWLKNHLFCPVSFVAASCFNYIGPCRRV